MTTRCPVAFPLSGPSPLRALLYRLSACSVDPFQPRRRRFQSTAAQANTGENPDLPADRESDEIKNDFTNKSASLSCNSSPNTVSPENFERPPSLQTTVVQSPVLLRKAARTKLHEKIPRKTDFDVLKRNPWARALASPLRMCAATQARVPKDFLGDYGLVEHPQSGSPWMMPVRLLGDEIRSMALGPERRAHESEEGEKSQEQEEAGPSEELQDSTEPPRRKSRPQRLPVIRIANNPALLSRIAKGANTHATRSLLPYRWKYPNGFLTKKENDSVIWREDLPEFVLTHMRKNVVRGLKVSCIVGKDHRWSVLEIDPKSTLIDNLENGLKSLGNLKNIKCGAVLLLKPQPEGSTLDGSPSIPELVKLPLQGTQIPIFYLPRLLSEENLQELRDHHEFFTKDAVLFRPSGDKTIYTMQGLWRLHSYVTIGTS
ncbi:uncharacterized protein CIMG_07617 [Coccidioides immitis RS]|uniref:Uncharacterized protein n=2 Tax=Coccidioides immitis TaxID=5501 RepID=A0A0E1S0N6_COCIM|nr:uncharacterized protein CIMG_07617 [Coccidioides immitis RS]EAS28871.1 hypothetical protein CIMG_07617 [Coccidioides immitis RS]TPX22957.1 hypothetical protein DIZ76_014838 [Coccidioides immitis]